MELSAQFERFLGNISVDWSKLNRLKSVHSKLRRALERDDYVGSALLDVFLQGSYIRGTANRPLEKSTDYDVDVCCLLDLSEVPIQSEEPKHLLRWLARQLKKIEAYRGRVDTRSRCIHIDFPDDFHMDVVPLVEARDRAYTVSPNVSLLGVAPYAGDMRSSNGNLFVPNGAVNGWEVTNSKSPRERYSHQDYRTNSMFTRVARILKYWRNQFLDAPALFIRLPNPSMVTCVIPNDCWRCTT